MIAVRYLGMPKKSKHATQLKGSTKSARRAKAAKTRVNVAGEMKNEDVKNYYRKVRNYMFANLVLLDGGPSLELTVKNYKQAVKSHRRISVNQ